MAYPGENENVDYLKYLEEHDLGMHEGPRLTKDEWLKMKMPKKTMDSLMEGPDGPKPPRVQY